MIFEEPINEIMELVGDDLQFETFSVKGVVGFIVENLRYGEATVYDVTKQRFSIRIPFESTQSNNITIDSEFYIEKLKFKYYFSVDSSPMPDITGWAKLFVNFIRFEQVI